MLQLSAEGDHQSAGANGLQQSDSGLSRSESSRPAGPDPRAKPFVPPAALAAKLQQSDRGGSDNCSIKSDTVGAASGGQQPRAGSGLRPGSGKCCAFLLRLLCLLWLHS